MRCAGHTGLVGGNDICNIMNNYFYSYDTLGVVHKDNLSQKWKAEGKIKKDESIVDKIKKTHRILVQPVLQYRLPPSAVDGAE